MYIYIIYICKNLVNFVHGKASVADALPCHLSPYVSGNYTINYQSLYMSVYFNIFQYSVEPPFQDPLKSSKID